jgi:PAS domain S-box-containing protein
MGEKTLEEITRAVRATHALRDSEARFAAAFTASPIAMAITTLDEGRYVDVNEAFEQQIGYSRLEVCGRTSLEMAVWPTPADRQAMVTAMKEQDTIRSRPTVFRTKSGGLITTLYSATLIEVDGLPCVLAAIQDITAQRVAEDALRVSEAKFRLLAETAPCGIFIYRLNGTIGYANPQMKAFTGYSTQDLTTMTIWDLVHPDSRDSVRARGLARSRGEEVPSRYEITIATRDGVERHVDFATTPTEFEGQPAFLGTAFDVTDSRRHERQAREHLRFLQALLETSPLAILVGGADHRIRFCNPAFERTFQYTSDETIGKDPDDLISLPENAEASDISRRVLSGQSVHATAIRRRKDGSRIHVDLHAAPLPSDGTFIGCLGIYQDITERVESEATLQELRLRLTRAHDEERAHLARELHDDISQRLALVALQLAEQASWDLAPTRIQQMDASRKLVDEILIDIHRLARRIHPSQLEHVGLVTALGSLCNEFTRRSGIAVDFDHGSVPNALPIAIKVCLYRVAQEAIRNAEQHSGADRVRVVLTASSSAIGCCVSDSGRGFSMQSTGGNGGLGLVGMAERVHSVGGTLSVQSADGDGTRIEVSIPLPPDEPSLPAGPR